MNAVELEAQPRETKKRNRNKASREAGRIPAVVYGGGEGENSLVEVDEKTFGRVMDSASSDTVLLNLKVGDASRLALVQEVQHHPVSRKTLHVDFREVKPDQSVIVTLPTVPVGEAVGVKTGGGTLEHVLRYIKVKGTPSSLPESIEVDVAALDIGQTLHVSDVVTADGVELLSNASNPVISISKPRVSGKDTTDDDEGAAAEGDAEGEGEAAVE
ncbi:MAG: 50S ribosomal protein L25 [Limisphaerales bacterium]